MHINSLDPQAIQQLDNLIAKCDFLQLRTSNDVYPQAPGSGLPLICVETPLCSAVISLQGAHLLEYKTTEGDPLLWVSPNCDFSPGAALRGGVPLCLPWFGVNREDPNKPKHGFARNNFWQLADARMLADGSVELEFLFVSEGHLLFAYDFSAELRMTLGQSAKLELTINNTDDEDFDCSWAMHNYYPVHQLAEVRVEGLGGRTYKDNLEGYAEKLQAGDVRFQEPVDRVFPGIDNSLKIIGSPSIAITQHNCPSVITWNPGDEAAANIADIGAGQEQFYICVERGAVLDEQWHLPAGSSKSAWMEFKQV
ncbi:D-hexose-6-phosphate mutarotase [Cellvibrio japonicus]|uniref:glucose-6-phosphate 1-epimerase n=1 Tax=Cellvibrio japonicus (strain Ueda107) TaxID=498211 RepID=B3PHI2_CELJU|nr:D-hexose-6-phosphate mutarotase [Cellvibrio japonicus]ACE84084.1 aldose 1-epimerase family protein [Cellvibrio japonicus Ueda107]QEI12460.1 D-hexose-6-phosphate mutarotase [Cellvibrio japonicus]QEI16034.1 D-hexose-6-phosphate mutarotase [Cellvibrio japonicus]QEI19612.1 D-hexose-6-phosphate mutarotase [Cellvibrio japonicus]